MPWDLLRYDTTKDGYLVNLSKEQLENAPKYNKDDHPIYTNEYGRGIYDYYGAPWSL